MFDWHIYAPPLVWLAVTLLSLIATRLSRRNGNGLSYETGRLQLEAVERREHRIRQLEQDYDQLLAYVWTILALLRQCNPGLTIPPPPIRSLHVQTDTISISKLRPLRAMLVDQLSIDELHNAAFDLGFDSQAHTAKGTLLRALIEHLENRQQEDLFLRWLKHNRPDLNLT